MAENRQEDIGASLSGLTGEEAADNDMSLDDAMKSIQNEIAEKQSGRTDINDNVGEPEPADSNDGNQVSLEHAISSEFKMPEKLHQNVPDLSESEQTTFSGVLAQARRRADEARRNKIVRTVTANEDETNEPEEDNSPFNDTYIDDEPDRKEDDDKASKKQPKSSIIKINGVEMDINNITKVRVAKDGKNYEKNRHRRIEARKAYQIVVPISGYSANMLSISSSEIINLSSLNVDEYRRVKAYYSKLYDKMRDPSVNMNYDEWLKCTAMFEQNTFWFGIFANTYPGPNEFTATCQGTTGGKFCGNEYKFMMRNSDFIDIPDGVTQDAIVDVIRNAVNARDLLSKSRVNTLTRVFCEEAQILVDIRVPSMYNFLEDTLANMRKVQQSMVDDVITNIMPFIEAVQVYNDDGTWLEVLDFDKKYQELYDLSDDDLKVIVNEIDSTMKELPQLNYSFKIPPCPKCGAVPTEEDLKVNNVSTLVFLTHQQRAAIASEEA